MNKTINFCRRNLKELVRDPLIYVFCLGFPLVMLVLFNIVNKYTQGQTPMFSLKALMPAITMFSYTFVMLVMALTISKDRQSFFLKRLYSFMFPSILRMPKKIIKALFSKNGNWTYSFLH